MAEAVEPIHDAGDSEEPERVLACPVCGQVLDIDTRRGVTVDVRREHGVWFDKGEFSTVISRLSRTARRRRESQVKEVRAGYEFRRSLDHLFDMFR